MVNHLNRESLHCWPKQSVTFINMSSVDLLFVLRSLKFLVISLLQYPSIQNQTEQSEGPETAQPPDGGKDQYLCVNYVKN